MVAQSTDNEAERRRWNDEYWASVWPRREQLTGAVTEVLLDAVGLAAGEQVLDIGSGGGPAAFAAAQRIGPTGSVVGADISVPLVGFATQRARDRGAANVRFVVADVQREGIDGAPFAVAISQFGVMFFDEPVVAFANIRAQLAPGGRLAFVCAGRIQRRTRGSSVRAWRRSSHHRHPLRLARAPPGRSASLTQTTRRTSSRRPDGQRSTEQPTSGPLRSNSRRHRR